MGNSQYSQLINRTANIGVEDVKSQNDEYIITSTSGNTFYSDNRLVVGGIYNINYSESQIPDGTIRTILESKLSSHSFIENASFYKLFFYDNFQYPIFKTTDGYYFINLNDKDWRPSLNYHYLKIKFYINYIYIGKYPCYSIISLTQHAEKNILISHINNDYITHINRYKYPTDIKFSLYNVYKIGYEGTSKWKNGKKIIERKIINSELSSINTIYIKFIKITLSKKDSNILETDDGRKFVNIKDLKWTPNLTLVYEVKFYNDKIYDNSLGDLFVISNIKPVKQK